MANKRLVCHGAGSLKLEDQELPEVPPSGVIVKVYYCGICRSDANVYEHGAWNPKLLPKVLGHEISGEIHEIGSQCPDDSLNIGDQVVVYPYGGCRQCDHCKAGSVDCTNKYQSYSHSYGVWQHGGYQHYMAVFDTWCILPVPQSVPMETACLVPCGGVTAYNAVQHCKDSIQTAIHIKGRANVLVVGAGCLGFWSVQILKVLYGEKVKICVVDVHTEKLTEFECIGATTTLCWPSKGDNKIVSSELIMNFHNELIDAALDFVNTKETIERVFCSLNFGSTLMMVGLFRSTLPPLSTVDMVIKHIKLQGIYSGSRQQVTEVMKLLETRQIRAPTISQVSLPDVEGVLQKMVKGEIYKGRTVVKLSPLSPNITLF